MTPPDAMTDIANPQKLRGGLSRIWHAAGYSLAGLRAGCVGSCCPPNAGLGDVHYDRAPAFTDLRGRTWYEYQGALASRGSFEP